MSTEEFFLKPENAEWVCSSNNALELKLVRPLPKPAEGFHPAFTYPLFGEAEQIYGYKNLKVKLHYSSGSLATYLGIQFSETLGAKQGATEIEKELMEHLGEGVYSNHDLFMAKVQEDYETFRPIGEKIHEYQSKKAKYPENVQEHCFEIYKATFNTPGFKEYHRRLQIFALFYIEGASYIEEDDDRWEIALIYEKLKIDGVTSYHIVGYCTMYQYFYFPDKIRMRISQFLILPPYRNLGHASSLYNTLYQEFLSRSNIVELTVEDPNEAFSDLRDRCDLRFLMSKGTFEGLSAPVDKSVLDSIKKQYKLHKRQASRLLEMALLKKLDKRNSKAARAYRLFVKARLYRFNEEALSSMDYNDRLVKLEETYRSVEEDYYRLLNSL
ncbi:histone acetyltransferase type B [Basidiobolus meristosporus CBS 931.73]|uniref:Histone acetyltransferase type B catalytic subunit n=1 Tax=Basidiobolus meristosporus CBS 931.73 TaxID=1314790 RepID=A0A1Y1YP37_9FUNG|nr:histone acetyltransferase type B [Basidiobolus meristosporus CBS 931.73]|eukprot:ORX99787.1 histone acetyltransferase type B [Basidiobolus meristosporus CBS 931.73]